MRIKSCSFPMLLILFLLAPNLTRADDGHYIRFESLLPVTPDGQPTLSVSSLQQGSRGFLWLGTQSGLARYDGYDFLFYPFREDPGLAARPLVVYPVIEDSAGDIWFGTHGDGLFRFSKDSEEYVRYRHDPDSPSSLSGDIVLALQEDASGNLWIGTRLNGLNRFDKETGTFTRIPLDPEADAIWDLLIDREDRLWIGTQDGGLFKVNPVTAEVANYRFNLDNPRSLGSNTIWSIFEDSEGTIWIGTKGGGLNRYLSDSEGFLHYYGSQSRPRDLAQRTITAIAEDESHRLWLGTGTDGLRILNPDTGEYVIYRNDPQDRESLSDNHISFISRDASGLMWVGSVRGGLNKSLSTRSGFRHFKHNPDNPRSIRRNDVLSICADGSEAIWVGTVGGLEKIDRGRGVTKRFTHKPSDPNSLSHNRVQAVIIDDGGKLWLGTAGGLDRLDPETGDFIHYRQRAGDSNSLSNNNVTSLWLDTHDPTILWVGTSRGLNKFEWARNRWTKFLHDPEILSSLSTNGIRAIAEDRTGRLWVGTNYGLNRLDKATGRSQRYLYDIESPSGKSLSDNVIHDIFEGKDGNVWIGTNRGLNRYESDAGRWALFSTEQQLPGNVITGILEDDEGHLWVSTNRGLARFNREEEIFKSFGVRDGIQGMVFNPGVRTKTSDGALVFGGSNGFNLFDPASIRPGVSVPPLTLTAFKVDNRRLKLQEPFYFDGRMDIPYKLDFLTFEFAVLDFSAPGSNRFAYRLDPRDEDWIHLGSINAVSFSNLRAGSYTLRVKGAGPDGPWNENGLTIPIVVIPPFWKTPGFAAIVFVFLLTGAVIVVRMLQRLKRASKAAGENLDRVIEKYRLTAREQEILRLILQGASNKDVEKRLFISQSTVRNHIYNIYQKLGVKNRLELINLIGRVP